MIPWVKPKIWGNERQALIDAFDSSWFSAGEYVNRLENTFSEIHQTKHAISTCNGTASLYLILDALKIGHGDKVIVPAFAFGAAANITSAIGAQPLFCEIEADTYLLDPIHLEKLLTTEKNVKAIMPVHSYGNVCDMKQIMALSKQFNVPVIEDAAESMFSKFNNQYCGTFGLANSFSFQTTKTITTAEGGCVLTDSDDLSERMKLIRSHGMAGEKKYWHYERGNNFRLSNLLASMGAAQLEFWKENVQQRDVLYKKHVALYSQIDGLKLQKIKSEVDPAMWAFPIYIKEGFSKMSRDKIMKHLKTKGIETRPGFYTFSQMKMYDAPTLPISDDVAANIICIPFYLDLREEEINYIHQEILQLKR